MLLLAMLLGKPALGAIPDPEAGRFNVLNYGLVADCKTSNTAVLAALLARAAATSAASGGQSEVVFPAGSARDRRAKTTRVSAGPPPRAGRSGNPSQ